MLHLTDSNFDRCAIWQLRHFTDATFDKCNIWQVQILTGVTFDMRHFTDVTFDRRDIWHAVLDRYNIWQAQHLTCVSLQKQHLTDATFDFFFTFEFEIKNLFAFYKLRKPYFLRELISYFLNVLSVTFFHQWNGWLFLSIKLHICHMSHFFIHATFDIIFDTWQIQHLTDTTFDR